jgi:hypothetical protein
MTKIGIPLGCITRWGSNFRLYEKLIGLRDDINAVLQDEEAVPHITEDLRTLCGDFQFWSDLQSLIDTLRPLVIRLTKLEGDGCISEVFKIWNELENIYDPDSVISIISKEVRGKVTEFLDERWMLFAEQIHCAAFLLDPRYRSIEVTSADLQNAERMIQRYNCYLCN